MKKFVLFLFLIISMTGCSNRASEFSVEGIIEEHENNIIGIHYPKTEIKSLNEEIEQYVFETKKQFLKEVPTYLSLVPSELNIDYEYWEVGNRYYNIVLKTFMTSPTLAHPIHMVKTFVYDSVKKQFLTLLDVAEIKASTIKSTLLLHHKDCILFRELENNVTEDLLSSMMFTFTDHSILLYFNPYEISNGSCMIIKEEIPFQNFKVEIEKVNSSSKTFEYHKVSKNLAIDKKTIALTFDDGPSKYTKEIVSLLEEYDSNATFFILGNKVKNYSETLNFVLEKGNELGNHSYNHKQLTRLSKEELKKQIEDTNQVVKDTLGYQITLLRPTYGAINNRIKKNIDMDLVLWNVDTMDWKLKNSKAIAKKALHDIKDGKIVLMHDIYKTTLEALKLILPELKKQGYQIVTVSELKEIQAIKNETEKR